MNETNQRNQTDQTNQTSATHREKDAFSVPAWEIPLSFSRSSVYDERIRIGWRACLFRE